MSKFGHLADMNNAWNAELYDDRASFVSALAADLVAWLQPKPGEKVLDLGCGTGTLSEQIARQGALVTGVDRSPQMVASAREKYLALRFEVADGQELAYVNEFDAVFSNAALHWMPRAADVLRGVHRALQPGGRFVAEFGGAGCVGTVVGALSQVLTEWGIDPARYSNWFFATPGQYAVLLEAHGLVPREIRYFERPTKVAGPAGLASWLSLFQAELMADLGSRWPDLCDRVADECRASLYRDGDWFLDYVRLRVLATKP